MFARKARWWLSNETSEIVSRWHERLEYIVSVGRSRVRIPFREFLILNISLTDTNKYIYHQDRFSGVYLIMIILIRLLH